MSCNQQKTERDWYNVGPHDFWYSVVCSMLTFLSLFSCFFLYNNNNNNIIIIIIIITYLTRVNPSAEAVINGCPVFSVVIWNDSLISNFLMVFLPSFANYSQFSLKYKICLGPVSTHTCASKRHRWKPSILSSSNSSVRVYNQKLF